MPTKAPEDVFEAFHRVVHDFKEGVPHLAALIGMPAGTLYNKANSNDNSHHKPTLSDAVVVSALTGDHRVLYAFAATLGEVCYPMPDLTKVSDAALLELITRVGAEGGDFHRAIYDGLGAHRFTRHEFNRVKAEGYQFIAAIAETIARIEGYLDA